MLLDPRTAHALNALPLAAPSLARNTSMHALHAQSAMALHQQPSPQHRNTTSCSPPFAPASQMSGAACESVAAGGATAVHASHAVHVHASQTVQSAYVQPPSVHAPVMPTGSRMFPAQVFQWVATRHNASSDSAPQPQAVLSMHGSVQSQARSLAALPPLALRAHAVNPLQHAPSITPTAAQPQSPQQQQQQPERTPTPAHGVLTLPAMHAIGAEMTSKHAAHARMRTPPNPDPQAGSSRPSGQPSLDRHAQHAQQQEYARDQEQVPGKGELDAAINEAVARMRSKLLADAPVAQLRISSLLGSGGFGTVYLGALFP